MLVDLDLPEDGGFALLRSVRDAFPGVFTIATTNYGTIRSAVEAMKMGAHEYVTKPLRPEEIRQVVRAGLRSTQRKRAAVRVSGSHAGAEASVVGRTHQMQRVFDLIDAVADSPVTVLMHGETGTGKSLIARALHERSRRREGPYVEVSCGAIPETLLESELFGHVKGAFTGAMSNKDGKFRAASGGTIFLDEISCASPSLQMKLLRVLQERKFEPLGSNRTSTVDVRVILATNLDLKKEVAAGRFREDLYYRINVVTIELPALRERGADIPLLCEHFIGKYAGRYGKSVRGVSRSALRIMQQYRWPGNVRELENCVERAVVLSRNHELKPDDLPPEIVNEVGVEVSRTGDAANAPTLKEALAEPERRIIKAALEANNWNRSATAEHLNINRTTLYKKMKRYGLLDSGRGS